jgi:hypothetical protein
VWLRLPQKTSPLKTFFLLAVSKSEISADPTMLEQLQRSYSAIEKHKEMNKFKLRFYKINNIHAYKKIQIKTLLRVIS